MRFSQRTHWELTPNRLMHALAELKHRQQPYYDLTQSNPTQAGFDYPRQTILEALARPSILTYQPDPQGWLPAREAIATYYQEELGLSVAPHSFFLTASTSEAYSYLFKLLTEPDEEILVPYPGYPLLEFLTRLEGVRYIYYPLRYTPQGGWHIDFEILQAVITPRTRAIVIVNPNNPTGSFLKKEEQQALNRLCLQHDLALISDEVFSDYGLGEPASRVRSLIGNQGALTFVLNGVSKSLGLPQAKLGWIQVGGHHAQEATACQRLEVIADSYLSVSTAIQHATPQLLAQRVVLQSQIQERLQSNEFFLQQQLKDCPCLNLLPREGGWYAVLQTRDILSDEERAFRLLTEFQVLVHPGYFYEFHHDGFLVLSLLSHPLVFQPGILRLVEAMSQAFPLI